MILLIKNLEIELYLGIYEHEKKAKTKALFDIEIACKNVELGAKNNLENLVDYDLLLQSIKTRFEGSKHDLIEDVIFETHLILKQQKNIESYTISVIKMGTHDYISGIKITKKFN